jgi:glycosyltransferase involved in cell wall biosynthesis
MFCSPAHAYSSTPLRLHQPHRPLYEARPRLPWLASSPSALPLLSLARLREVALEYRNLQNTRIQGREELRNVSAFDLILANSLFSRESILRAFGLDSEVCYLGTDLARFTDHGRPREDIIVGLGSYTPAKNLQLVIEAIALLPPPRPLLAWIGNDEGGGYRQQMIALAQSWDVPFDAHLNVPDDDVIALLNRATAMVYAPRLEPFGLAAIEAAACGLPVLAVAEGGPRESVIDGETGLLVANSAPEVSAAIARLLSNPTFARQLGAQARTNVERRWSLESATDRIETALLRAIAS